MAARPHSEHASRFHLTRRTTPQPSGEPSLLVLPRVNPNPPATLHRHPYRLALCGASLMAGLAVVVWAGSAEALHTVSDGVGWLEANNSGRGRALATVLCATVGLLLVVGAWGRETAERRPVRLAGGRARMAVDEVAAAVRDALLEDTMLAGAAVRVQNLHWRGLRVTVRADLQPQARVDETVEAVDEVVTTVVQGWLGVRLAARPTVDVRYQELDLRLGRGT